MKRIAIAALAAMATSGRIINTDEIAQEAAQGEGDR